VAWPPFSPSASPPPGRELQQLRRFDLQGLCKLPHDLQARVERALLKLTEIAPADAQVGINRVSVPVGLAVAVYGLVSWWAAEGQESHRARRALRLQRLEVSGREDPYAAVIRCTADPTKADKRTRSKWSRVMRYAAGYKPDSEPLDLFIRRKGAAQLPCEPGLNCAHPQIRSRPTGACRGGPFRFQLFFARWRQSSVAPAVCQPTIADPDVSPTSRSFR
jgi:hypothetical protein